MSRHQRWGEEVVRAVWKGSCTLKVAAVLMMVSVCLHAGTSSDISGPPPQWQVGQKVRYGKTVIEPGKPDVMSKLDVAIVKREISGLFWIEASEVTLGGDDVFVSSRLVTQTSETTCLKALIFEGAIPWRASRIVNKSGAEMAVELDGTMIVNIADKRVNDFSTSIYESAILVDSGNVTTSAGTFDATSFRFPAQVGPKAERPAIETVVLSSQVPIRGIVRMRSFAPPVNGIGVTKTVELEIESIATSATAKITETPFRLRPVFGQRITGITR